MRVLRGLNWGHRRAQGPMDAATMRARDELGIDVHWQVQSLAGFEHGLDARVADRFDVVVFDHPFCGSVAAGGWMHPLEAMLDGVSARDFVGASLASYRYAGHLWALPVDGATQAAVYRPDVIGAGELPPRWADIDEVARGLRRRGRAIGIAAKSPHGILALLALCANLGTPLALDPWADPFDREVLAEAAELLREVVALADRRSLAMNAIDLHDAMVREDMIAYCPLAYVYTTYAEADQRRPLAFAPWAGSRGDAAGSVLGGTGLGVTRGCGDPAAAAELVRWLARSDVQRDTFMRAHGQPGRVEAWSGAPADALFAGAHASLRRALETAWMRPRFPGYIRWQAEAGRGVERFLAGKWTTDDLVIALHKAWHACAPALHERHGASSVG